MRAVNLLPEDAQPRKVGLPPLAPTIGVAASVLALGVVVAAVHVESGTVSSRQHELDAVQQRLAQVTAAAPKSSGSAVSLLGTRGQRIAALNAALSGRVAYDRVLNQFALVLPDDVWLDSLLLSSAPAASTDTTTPAPSGVTITGYTYTAESLARLLQRLSVVPTLKDVALTTATTQHRGSKDVLQFSLTANLAGGAS
jgi:Tfp pilus assembly protein PilN